MNIDKENESENDEVDEEMEEKGIENDSNKKLEYQSENDE